ncbi:MAG: hypothetical protein ACLFUC_04625, partial [Bacteroidales bacterium]
MKMIFTSSPILLPAHGILIQFYLPMFRVTCLGQLIGSRLAKLQKTQFTDVIEQFWSEHNQENGHY